MENKNPIAAYVDYLRRLAEAHTEIQDFKYLDFAMLQGAANAGTLKTPVLMADTVKGSFADANADTPIPVLEGGFAVFFPVPPEDYEGELAALGYSYRIGLDILGRMDADQSREDWFLDGFDRSRVKWEAMGPVCDNLFGILFTFRLCVEETEGRHPAMIWADYAAESDGSR